ncbi:hypothetical protein [Bradyrhizobium brasilense]|uniref:hypothetical protein n=1 Tax=Bradyrhizobium brasilense TaxID=1419277 RepID=UPI001E46CB79|nr:hypothetical protein [Bradyrhizobium brasilense]
MIRRLAQTIYVRFGIAACFAPLAPTAKPVRSDMRSHPEQATKTSRLSAALLSIASFTARMQHAGASSAAIAPNSCMGALFSSLARRLVSFRKARPATMAK